MNTETPSKALTALTFFSLRLEPEQIARLMNIELDVLASLVSKYITF